MPRPNAPAPLFWAAFIALGLSFPSLASADERPLTWDMSRQELQSIGLGQSQGDPVPVPDHVPHERSPNDPVHAKQGTIFVNFDGATLSSGNDDSRENRTQLGQLVGQFAPYGEGAKRDAVMEAVRADWAAYNMIITDQRPGSGDYTMNMTGPSNPFGGGVLGIAPVDCADMQTHNNITYAFHSVNDSFSAAVTATTIGQEVAHSYGLEHVNEPGDIMNPYNAGGDAAFNDRCIAIVQNLYCGFQHEPHCGTQSEQNAHQELLELFGTNVPDTAAPEVMITFPEDGDVYPAGSDFEIFVVASDDVSVAQVQLYNNGEALEVDASEPYGWEVVSIPDGEYELHVIATDSAQNESMSNVVTITVGDAPPMGESDGEADSGESDGEEDSGDPPEDEGEEDEDEGEDGLPEEFGDDAADTGCGCNSTPAPAALWLLLGFLPLIRRRR